MYNKIEIFVFLLEVFMEDIYRTVKQDTSHEIVIERSRFIAHVKEVTTEDDAQNFIAKIKKEHWSATHNCSAYLIGARNEIQKANDDGEPSGTAGVPMLEVLKKLELKNTVVVVTRYFGGIKLGAGGLVRAYSKSTKEGLVAAGVVERKKMYVIRTEIDYTFLGKIENQLRNSMYMIKEIIYGANVEIDCYVDLNKQEEFETLMKEITNGTCHSHILETNYLENEISI